MEQNRPVLLVGRDSPASPSVGQLLKQGPLGVQLVHAATAADARRYLLDAGRRRPCLVLLDLSHIQEEGLDLLAAIKQERTLSGIPTVILADSADSESVDKAFSLGAAGYIIKPEGLDRLTEMVTAISQYWTLSELPAPAGA